MDLRVCGSNPEQLITDTTTSVKYIYPSGLTSVSNNTPRISQSLSYPDQVGHCSTNPIPISEPSYNLTNDSPLNRLKLLSRGIDNNNRTYRPPVTTQTYYPNVIIPKTNYYVYQVTLSLNLIANQPAGKAKYSINKDLTEKNLAHLFNISQIPDCRYTDLYQRIIEGTTGTKRPISLLLNETNDPNPGSAAIYFQPIYPIEYVNYMCNIPSSK